MYELSVAFKYLRPRWRQLSVSIISLISISVIALVVWLVVVFFSVTHGLEKLWIKKLIALTAPIRVTPTEAYYQSYYYQVDAYSDASDYSVKTIGEKLQEDATDPYQEDRDGELPVDLPKPDLDQNGKLKDLVGIAFEQIRAIPELSAYEYEITASQLKLHLVQGNQSKSVSQAIYLISLEKDNPNLFETVLPLTFEEEKKIPSRPQSGVSFRIQSDLRYGEGILLPKSFRDIGVAVGDIGYLSYHAPTASALREQHQKVYVAGFYDPGIIPVGGKFVLANPELVSLIRSSHMQDEAPFSNGINVRFADLEHAEQIKKQLLEAFQKEGIAPYWRVETYREYDFTKEILQQLQSERNLWTLLATVIIIVACSNIISMLIILVNDKKREIGILRSMGSTTISIAFIFGICGVFMGMAGSILGTLAAILTLTHLQSLIQFIGYVQGYELLNPHFYGDALPNQMSFDAVLFVILTTAGVSLIAGIVPALKACTMKPSTILRSE